MITHLKRYITIIQDSDVYPVIYDSNNVVLSLPPVINDKLLIRKIFKISHLLNCLGDHKFQIGRTSLLPGLLKTLASNQGTALPIQLFEKTGSRYERCLCEIYYNHTPGFEIIHGLLDRIMTLVKVSYNENKTNDIDDYLNNQYENSVFFPDQHAEIIVYGKNLDAIGVLHPNVIEHFGLKSPCSILELNIEPFV
ncbi:unnamed protein product [Rotaria sp. Silwood1]|nr:unnamed protein product [Rotaria sp. Silwood1]